APVIRDEDQITVAGTVTDANGDPLPGVTVSVLGTTIGTATDLDGVYSLSVPDGSDRKSTRLNSSHVKNSYAVFCLKKKKEKINYNDNKKSKRTEATNNHLPASPHKRTRD